MSINQTSQPRKDGGVSLPDFVCWSKIGYDAQELPVILQRKDHERLYGEGEVWWGVGEINLRQRISALVDRYRGADPLVILTPQPTKSPKGDGKVLVWRDYLDATSQRRVIPPHALVLSAATTGQGRPKEKYFALVFRCDVALTESSGAEFFPNQWRNLGSEKEGFGGSQVTTAIERKKPEPLPSSNPYKIAVRAFLVKPHLVQLANSRRLTDGELQSADEAGKRTFSREKWLELVGSIRQDG